MPSWPSCFTLRRIVLAAAGALAYLWRDLPYNLGLLAAVFVGVAVGMALLRLRARAAQGDAA